MKIIFYIFVLIDISLANSFLFKAQNDVIHKTDRHFTQNGQLSWMYDSNNSAYNKYSYTIMQNIYTPENIKSKDETTYDMPYAGHLYGEFLYYKVYDNYFYAYGFNFGTIGKYSLAKEVQTTYHKISENPRPQGWDTQIGNQFTGGISAIAGHKTTKDNLVELNEGAQLYIGNWIKMCSVSMVMRVGENYPNNYKIVDFYNGNQINIEQRNKEFGWSISYGIFANYYDYFYILDKYKEQYNINRNNIQYGNVLYFDIFHNNLQYSISFNTTMHTLNRTKGEIKEEYLQIAIIYSF